MRVHVYESVLVRENENQLSRYQSSVEKFSLVPHKNLTPIILLCFTNLKMVVILFQLEFHYQFRKKKKKEGRRGLTWSSYRRGRRVTCKKLEAHVLSK